MKKRIEWILRFVVFMSSFNTFSQSNDSLIIWNKHKLKFNDFKLKKNELNRASALSILTMMPVVTNRVNGNCDLIVLSTFNKNRSFMAVKNIQLLEHEQLHFDIYELICRKIRKRNSVLKKCNAKIKNFYKYKDSVNQYSKKLDKETDFGLNYERQVKWNKEINEKLNKLKEFAIGS